MNKEELENLINQDTKEKNIRDVVISTKPPSENYSSRYYAYNRGIVKEPYLLAHGNSINQIAVAMGYFGGNAKQRYNLKTLTTAFKLNIEQSEQARAKYGTTTEINKIAKELFLADLFSE